MPPNESRPGGESGAAKVSEGTQTNLDHSRDQDVPAQLRRRRAASRRFLDGLLDMRDPGPPIDTDCQRLFVDDPERGARLTCLQKCVGRCQRHTEEAA